MLGSLNDARATRRSCRTIGAGRGVHRGGFLSDLAVASAWKRTAPNPKPAPPVAQEAPPALQTRTLWSGHRTSLSGT